MQQRNALGQARGFRDRFEGTRQRRMDNCVMDESQLHGRGKKEMDLSGE